LTNFDVLTPFKKKVLRLIKRNVYYNYKTYKYVVIFIKTEMLN